MGSKQQIFFRVDGSETIGYGHVFRCIALAQMLCTEFNCVFATRLLDSFIKNTIINAGFNILELKKEDSHFNEFLNILQGNEIIVLDNYFFETSYQKAIKDKGCKLVCIDDIHDKHFVADIVINHAEGVSKTSYSVENDTKLLLGYRYALLRPEFLSAAKTQKNLTSSTKNVIINLGGTDPEKLIIKATNTFLRHPEIDSVSLISKIDTAKFINPYNKPIFQYWNISSDELSNIMLSSDIGFLPASTVSIEACACRLPLIAGWFVNNQINIYNAIVDKNLAIGVGNISDVSGTVIYDAISKLVEPDVYTKIITLQQMAVDGNSSVRLIDEFRKL